MAKATTKSNGDLLDLKDRAQTLSRQVAGICALLNGAMRRDGLQDPVTVRGAIDLLYTLSIDAADAIEALLDRTEPPAPPPPPAKSGPKRVRPAVKLRTVHGAEVPTPGDNSAMSLAFDKLAGAAQ